MHESRSSGGAGRTAWALVILTGLVVLFTIQACGGDDAEGPAPDKVIVIHDTNFFPSDVTVRVGERVEWQNRTRETKSVTSGLGSDDPDAGKLFDQTLAGYRSGEAIGGRFQKVFTLPDTIRYFNRFPPAGFTQPFTGMVIVTY